MFYFFISLDTEQSGVNIYETQDIKKGIFHKQLYCYLKEFSSLQKKKRKGSYFVALNFCCLVSILLFSLFYLLFFSLWLRHIYFRSGIWEGHPFIISAIHYTYNLIFFHTIPITFYPLTILENVRINHIISL